jgi:predicted acetyltransferase
MPALVPPHSRYHRSFVEAVAEEPGSVYLFRGSALDLADPARFAGYVDALLADADPETPRPPGYVPGTTLWWVDGDTYLGRVSVRHLLNETLRTIGGHIGYWIRPSARGHGHGRDAFRASLPVAAALGIDPALLTCDEDNLASRRIIEGAGGVFENQIGVKRRYWVPTRPAGRPANQAGATRRQV